MPSTPTILVAGDIVLDHHIYEGERQHFLDETARGLHIVPDVGGAALTHRLIEVALQHDHAREMAAWTAKKESAAKEQMPFAKPAPAAPVVDLAGARIRRLLEKKLVGRTWLLEALLA